MSGNANDGLIEEWLNVNMPSGTIIGDPKWWAKNIRKVLSYENANLAKPQPQPTPRQSVDDPADLYQYEIMDRTHIICEMIDSALLGNAGITPEQTQLVNKALDYLGRVYQDSGRNSYIDTKPQPTPIQSDEERVEFEKSFSNYYLGKFTDTANYINSETDGAWTGWQARANLSNPQPMSQDVLDGDLIKAAEKYAEKYEDDGWER